LASQRLPLLEAAVLGQRCDANLGAQVQAAHLAALAPIDDMRASGAYRLDAALVLLQRLLSELGALT
jgi:CO/xanthine dehydrogenase FAD-binding subunit